MPELPEVESARATIERSALHRRIANVDDTDTYECRPHAPGDIRAALVGRELTAAHRQGKTMWVETSDDGPELGLHLGMSGRILVTGPDSRVDEGGDYLPERLRSGRDDPSWTRFAITFEDGGSLALHDKRRLGRARLDPDRTALGPDAEHITRDDFRTRIGHSKAPVKARLLDQHVIAGVGNLLADEALWRAQLRPARPADELSTDDLDRLRRSLRSAIRFAIGHGGVHTGEFAQARGKSGHCPRCGAPLSRGTVGGRTTYWCPVDQAV
ncbi:formamidopyrimidine-DNA glycosylase [Branchiibius hedensis]|uniref:Formamidopyrimidine-DNA glycosylase n=1 Tax=Branchiibius hedensis TaxID=672460 RepID=A0A2Y9A236_9MICO|nr:DNA-formamidopyrimidine glycosylase family protein [Branchiibius hedensis]PWJ27457.1 formamidopyrimidine-DNA glycosylase [Branchiibius hedensis]SSA36267.1 formamidopyrimidine-DNA glycosylase [Branchiibius hedensis]